MAQRLTAGALLTLKISDLAATGKSIGKHDGMVVMADGGLPGEVIECEITGVKRRYAFARMLKVIETSPMRVEPRCRHFAVCGGCKWQDLDYEKQVGFKRNFIVEALKRIGRLPAVPVEPTVKAVEPYYYRNKMEYSFGDDGQQPTAGLHIRGRYDAIFQLQECFLQSERSVAALAVVRRTARQLQIPFYDYRIGRGQLRFLVVREGKRTGDLMLNLVTFGAAFSGHDELFKAVRREIPDLTALFQTVNEKKANVATGDELIHVSGREYITEQIGDLTFQVTPFSFMQTNSAQTEILYNVIRDHAQLQADHRLLDLFCGCGTIALYLARQVGSVLGIEINPDAIMMARTNAELNRIANVDFVAADVRRELVALKESERRFDTIITDPPRAGLEAKAVRRIARLEASRIVAVSCNPATLARDLALFAEHGYQVTRVTPVDMFPQTAHVEAVATLVRE